MQQGSTLKFVESGFYEPRHTLREYYHQIQPGSEETQKRILATLVLPAVPYLDVSQAKLYEQDSGEDRDFGYGKVALFRRGRQHDIVWEAERHVAGLWALGNYGQCCIQSLKTAQVKANIREQSILLMVEHYS